MGVSNKTPEFLKMNPIGKVGPLVLDSSFYKPYVSYAFFFFILKKGLLLRRFPCLRHPMVLYLRVTPLHAMVRLSFKLNLWYFDGCCKIWVLLLLLLSAVTRVKADNPLFGSSLIEYVSDVWVVCLLKNLFCRFWCPRACSCECWFGIHFA